MKTNLLAVIFILGCAFIVDAAPSAPTPPAISMRPFCFTENKGQVIDMQGKGRSDIYFTAASGNTKVYLTPTSIHYQFVRVERTGRNAIEASGSATTTEQNLNIPLLQPAKTSTLRFTVSLQGANPAPKMRKELQKAYFENFYMAHCPQGITGVSTYERIVWEDVYPGIDWVLYSSEGGLKYDFIVHPGASPNRIKLKITGAEASIADSGDLLMSTPLGNLSEQQPVSFAAEKNIGSRFIQTGDHEFGFAIDAYDAGKTLVIDPKVSWATYYGGGASNDYAQDCATDASGNVYMTGYTQSSDFPTTAGAYQTAYNGNDDAILVKFNSSGVVQWATYYGGADADEAFSCATDNVGNIYIAGGTNAGTFPVSSGAAQTSFGGNTDLFLVKMNSSGVRQWATFFGGSDVEVSVLPAACATDKWGNVFVTGYTKSMNFPVTSSAFQTTRSGTEDAYMVKFNSSGALKWATLYGSSGADDGAGCATDDSGNVFMVGSVLGGTFPTTSGAFQTTGIGNYSDAFLVKFDSIGARKWATLYSGSEQEQAYGVTVDAGGSVYICGGTKSGDFPVTSGATQSSNAQTIVYDAFLVKFNGGGGRQWATYYGGTQIDVAISCVADAGKNIYLSGYTYSTNFPTTAGAMQASNAGASDAWLAKFSESGGLHWASYYGGSADDLAEGSATDASNNFYMAGITSSTNFPTTSGAAQTTFNASGYRETFMVKVQDINVSVATGSLCAGGSVAVTYSPTTTYNSGNVFTAELSNASGSFAIPVTIGSIASTSGGTITATIPAATPIGSGYRIRVVSSNPSVTGVSNGLNLIVTAPVTPTATISSSPSGPVGIGTPVTFSVSQTGGGSAPTYQWVHNGIDIPGATSATYTESTLQTGDRIWVRMQSSNMCVTKSSVNSDTVLLEIWAANVGHTSSYKPVILYPNPNNGSFTLTLATNGSQMTGNVTLAVKNTIGGTVYSSVVASGQLATKQSIQLPETLPAGFYILQVHNEGVIIALPFIIKH